MAGEKHVPLARVSPTGGGGTRVREKDVLAYLSQLPKATPVAANMAARLGMDLTGVTGTGPKGAVTKADIERAIQEKPARRPGRPVLASLRPC